MKLIVLLITFLLASCGVYVPESKTPNTETQAIGGLSGQWKATKVTDTVAGLQRTCESSLIVIEKSGEPNSPEATYTIRERVFLCANKSYETRWRELVLVEKNGKLYQEGTAVGEVDDNFLSAELVLGGATQWKISIAISGETLKYQESVTGGAKTSAVLQRL